MRISTNIHLLSGIIWSWQITGRIENMTA